MFVRAACRCCVADVTAQAAAVSDDKTPVVSGWQPPTLQPPFQPTASPVSLSARFMVGDGGLMRSAALVGLDEWFALAI